MELAYLWLEEYLNIRYCGFNFGNRITVREEINIEQKTIKLKITDNQSYIEGFYGRNIKNIISIVGANGVGKSNLLDFLKSFLLNKNYRDGKWLAIFFDSTSGTFFTTHSLYKLSATKGSRRGVVNDWQISFSNRSSYRFRRIQRASREYNIMDEEFGTAGAPFVQGLESSVIFYNPFLDFKDYSGGKWTANYTDISTNYLIYTDTQGATTERDKFELHRFKNIERQFLLVQNNRDLVAELNLPSDLQVRFIKTDEIHKDDLGFRITTFYEKFRKATSATWNQGPNAMIDRGRKSRSKKTLEDGVKLKMKMWFCVNLVSNYLYNFSYIKDLNGKYFQGDSNVNDFDFENDDTLILTKQFFQKLTFPNNRQFNFTGFIDLVTEIIDNQADVLSAGDFNECYFYAQPEVAIQLWNWHHNYLAVFPADDNVRGFLELNWRDISSGEKSFLDLFSRLYSAITTISNSDQLKLPVYVLLDEAEVGFHPFWQKSYLSYLIRFFEKAQALEFILILTTHSPFIVSDLPSDNLILLDKTPDGFCLVRDSLDSVKKTFGANIHTLLSDSFFMQDGLIGNFAKGKINAVIAWMKSSDKQQAGAISKVIGLIDEPLIKTKLIELYAEKMGLDFEEERIKEQILRLNNRLDEINKEKEK